MGFDIRDIAQAGSRKITQLDYVTHNLANVATPGFKSEHLYYAIKNNQTQETFVDALGPMIASKDFSQGTLQKTGRELDLAIEGDGYFVIEKKTSTAYSRNGSFVLNNKNELVTSGGDYVLGESGHIVINGNSVQIGADGTVTVDGNTAGKVKIVAFEKPGNLTRGPEGHYIDDQAAGVKKAENSRIAAGYLEMSNVSAVKEMIEMMDVQRSFETYQKIITTLADLDKISTNRIGKLT